MSQRSYMIISMAIEKVLNKTQHLFLIKKNKQTCRKLAVEGNFLNLTRGIYKIYVTNNIIYGERPNPILPPRSAIRQISALTTSVQHCAGGSNLANRERKAVFTYRPYDHI